MRSHSKRAQHGGPHPKEMLLSTPLLPLRRATARRSYDPKPTDVSRVANGRFAPQNGPFELVGPSTKADLAGADVAGLAADCEKTPARTLEAAI